jgi:hypothetical protein
VNRQTFFRTLLVNGLRLCCPASSFWRSLLDTTVDSESQLPLNDLYQEAMQLGIDPASMDYRLLRAIVAENREPAPRQPEI